MKNNIFFDIKNNDLAGAQLKNLELKRGIIRHFYYDGDATIADLCRKFNSSIPTITKLIEELLDIKLVLDYGKIDTSGGRKPNLYGINPDAGYIIGVDVHRKNINMAMFDLRRKEVHAIENNNFELKNTVETLELVCKEIEDFIVKTKISKNKLLGIGLNLTGRVNSKSGYSYSYFNFSDEPLSTVLEKRFGCSVFIENDTRAMAYGEMLYGIAKDKQNVLYLNLSRGIGLGIITNGQLYYGNSGFSGEFGHIPIYDNEKMCHCGKKGCLETEVSGYAIEDACKEGILKGATTILSEVFKRKGTVSLEDIIEAVNKEDVFAIELVTEVGEKMGKAISILINLFNPELIIIGGRLSLTGNFISMSIQNSINKYSLRLLSENTEVKVSKLGTKVGVIGASALVGNMFFAAE